MKLAWSNHATTDRLAIFVWIINDSPQSAAHVGERIEAAARRLKDFPTVAIGPDRRHARTGHRAPILRKHGIKSLCDLQGSADIP